MPIEVTRASPAALPADIFLPFKIIPMFPLLSCSSSAGRTGCYVVAPASTTGCALRSARGATTKQSPYYREIASPAVSIRRTNTAYSISRLATTGLPQRFLDHLVKGQEARLEIVFGG